ncbi:YphA family membrane protein [Aneurinibacillus terranovensis]|uniref:YphA family membrane protein n=1 Tax=Aneurinibacillus terranovensis TaxID=278991 RepID=UPI0004049C99|nr:hypothetical protein [Aneurinibacillus terranovensis]
MNPGYLSLLCLFIIYVLYWMGSLQPVFRSLCIKPALFLFALPVGCLLSSCAIPFTSGVSVSLGYILWLGLFMMFWGREGYEVRLYLFPSAMLVGVSLFLLRYVLQLDPVLQFMAQPYFVAVASLVITFFLAYDISHTFIMTGLGLCMMEIFDSVWLYSQAGEVTVGDLSFIDVLLLSLLVSTVGKQFTSVILTRLTNPRKLLLRKGR